MACMNKSLYRKSMGKKKKEMDNLAKDAAAALAAGMSYGKWKAMQDNPVVIGKKEELPELWKVCKRCGKKFKPSKYGRGRQIYCEIECQKAAQYERNQEKEVQRVQAWREKKKAEAAE